MHLTRGGTGQQSKIFEPISKGKILICDPRLVYGWNLQEGKHYLPATTSDEFVNQILKISNDIDLIAKMKTYLRKWVNNNLLLVNYDNKILNFIR